MIRDLRKRDLFIPDVTKKDIEEIEILLAEKSLILQKPPEILEKILIAWRGKEREYSKHTPPDSLDVLGTTNLRGHAVKKPCPKCQGRGWIVDEEAERKAIEREKRRLRLNKEP